MLTRIKQSGLVAVLTLALGLGVGIGLASPAQTAYSQAAADAETTLFRGIYQKANPSVVSIDVRLTTDSGNRQASPFGGPGQQGQQPFTNAAGSGFVYDTKGHIVTNAHVVEGADRIEVTFTDQTTMMATVVGSDPDSDIAVLQVQGDASHYQPLTLADSNAVQVGDRVAAIGNPFEYSGTMTQGIVSGTHRSVQGLQSTANGAGFQIPDAIQTDAAVNPGNSGGPLLDDQAEVIGITEQIASQVRQSSGVSFAIPSNIVKQIAETFISGGKVEHSWLGIAGTSLSLDSDQTLNLPAGMHGVYVDQVQSGSPAAQAGLKGSSAAVNNQSGTVAPGGDVIVAIDHQPVKQFDDLMGYLFTKTKVGQTVTLTIVRGGKQMDLQVTLQARPSSLA
ncbi:MAG TPA: trypsin-like peptidase domain-containing protein [Aggregatilineales bacterium]|nr:trypsin-like peptidase domain-containing protein [Aggregatilineales bacterium]